MKIRCITIMAMLCCILPSISQNYDAYYTKLPVELKRVEPVSFPSARVSVEEFGCKGDGLTLNTDGFARAIDSLSARGGGVVVVPEGLWLTGPIVLKDNINLHLEKNAVIFMSPDKSLYTHGDPTSNRMAPCISAVGCKNIGVTGKGVIDGNGSQWRYVKRGKVSDVEWKRFLEMGGVERRDGKLWYAWDLKNGAPNVAASPEKQEKRRNDLLKFTDCENVLLEGVTVQNSPRFHVHPYNSHNLIIDGITVRCPWNAQNGDGIDLTDCHRVLLINSTVDTGDDGICLKSAAARSDTEINGCEDMMICDNIVYHAHGGFVIGSNDICGVRRVVVRDCTFSGTETGLRFKSAPGRGGRTADIYISDIVMTDIIGEGITISCDYLNFHDGNKQGKAPGKEETENIPYFNDIHISNIACYGAKTGVAASGIEGLNCVEGITVSNSVFVYRKTGKKIDEQTAKIAFDNVKFVNESSTLNNL